MLRTLGSREFAELDRRALESTRRRANLDLHPELSDPIQRFFNRLEPGTYVRPHRHPQPGRWEAFLGLAGRAAAMVFDADGWVLERAEIGAGDGNRLVEIPAGAWHTLVCLETGTLLFELKPGPYDPATDKVFAEWAPVEDAPEATDFVQRLVRAQPGDQLG